MTKKLARWVAGLCIGLCCHRPAKNPHTITIPLKYRAEILDPLHAVDESTVMVVNFLHRRLYEYTPDGKLEPVLVAAEKREGRRVWLHLKPGPVSPEDVVYALERVQKDANQSWVLEQIRRVRKHGPDSVELELAASARPAETEWQLARIKLSLPQCAIFRAAEHKTHKQFIPFSRYRLAEQMGDRILLAASDGSPSLEFIAMPEESARYFAFREGRVDVYEATGIHRQLAHENPLYEPRTMYDLIVLYAAFLVPPNSALRQAGLRRAINLAFDRTTLCAKTLLGACVGADYPVPAVLSPPPPWPFPPAGEYSLPPETEAVTLFTIADKERLLIVDYMRNIFQKFRIRLEPRIVDLPTMVRENNKGTYGIYLMKWSADYPHAENFLMPLFYSASAGVGGNRAHVSDPVLDKMLERTTYSVNEVQRIQQRIREISPWLFIGFQNQQFFRLKGSPLEVPSLFAGWGVKAINAGQKESGRKAGEKPTQKN